MNKVLCEIDGHIWHSPINPSSETSDILESFSSMQALVCDRCGLISIDMEAWDLSKEPDNE